MGGSDSFDLSPEAMVRLTKALLPELVAGMRANFQEASSSGECDFTVGSASNASNITSNEAGRSYKFSHAAGHGSMRGNATEITSNATGINGNAATNIQSNDPRVTSLPSSLWRLPILRRKSLRKHSRIRREKL